jgi:hypothetical protein
MIKTNWYYNWKKAWAVVQQYYLLISIAQQSISFSGFTSAKRYYVKSQKHVIDSNNKHMQAKNRFLYNIL